MTDYQCFPLWEASPGVVGNINPQDLPISTSLREALLAWAAKYDATLNMADPLSSGFDSRQAASEFREEGDALAQRLQKELGENYTIVKNIKI